MIYIADDDNIVKELDICTHSLVTINDVGVSNIVAE